MAIQIIKIEDSKSAELLKQPAQEILFPLSNEMHSLIDEMKLKIKQTFGSGLAAPQTGNNVRLILFQVSPFTFTLRNDVAEPVPLTVLINPSYTPVEKDGKIEEWEGCHSISDFIAKVPRYNTIMYQGYSPDGKLIKGRAKDYLARVLQHEIDHTRGLVITDNLTPSSPQGKPAVVLDTFTEEDFNIKPVEPVTFSPTPRPRPKR